MVTRALLRPLFVLALLSLLIPTLVAAQGVDVKTVGMVTPASSTNLGWDQQGADGLTEASAKTLGIKVEVQENGGYDDITPILKDLADRRATDHLPRQRLPDDLPGVRGRRSRSRWR